MDHTCHDGVCAKCCGAKFIVIGAVVLFSAMYWPDRIWHVIGLLLIIKGGMKLIMPTCGHCSEETKKSKK